MDSGAGRLHRIPPSPAFHIVPFHANANEMERTRMQALDRIQAAGRWLLAAQPRPRTRAFMLRLCVKIKKLDTTTSTSSSPAQREQEYHGRCSLVLLTVSCALLWPVAEGEVTDRQLMEYVLLQSRGYYHMGYYTEFIRIFILINIKMDPFLDDCDWY